jgi:hypothetical protein
MITSDLNYFESLINLCAAKHSQELNISALSRASGVASITAKKWVGLLHHLGLPIRKDCLHRSIFLWDGLDQIRRFADIIT